jgi:hypothetical protein
MSSTSGDGPAAGWYADPEHPGQQRYWDGAGWTEHRHPSTTSGPDDTAVLPRTEPRRTDQGTASVPVVQSTAATGTAASGEGGSRGWVAALVGLIVGLVVGGTAAAVVVGNNDDSSTPADSSSSAAPASTVTATSSATATESVTTTATVTATATVTVTTSPSP